MSTKMLLFYIFIGIVIVSANASNAENRGAFDQDLYERVLDPVQCREQLLLLANDSLGLRFVDASGRLPSGVAGGHLADLGDYHQCLRINEYIDGYDILGKYCTISIPLEQNPVVIPETPDIPWPDIPWPPLPDNTTKELLTQFWTMKQWAHAVSGTGDPVKPRVIQAFTAVGALTLGICVPKVCSPTETISFLQENISFLNLTFSENYCRLPNDKPFSPADYLAMAIFSLLALITFISTSYDIYQMFVLKRELSETSTLYRSFSIYTNTSRFLNFKSSPGALECIDGIRAISMLWVIVGHVYSLTLLGFVHNLADIVTWITSFPAVWINSAPITVDTFFLLSGMLCVYSTIGKINRRDFVRSVHLFYLNRLLRMFPLLAIVALLQASLLFHVADGPFWQNVGQATMSCRRHWWSTLLHIQNYVNTLDMCLYHTWYLAVDVQLYMVCPLVLFCLFGSKPFAWCALVTITILSLVATNTYSFIFNFSAALTNPSRMLEFSDYFRKYYINTLTRASPFCVGMMYGYLLHLYRGRKIRIPKVCVWILWILTFLLMAFAIFSIYPVVQQDHTAQDFDNFLNSYIRAIWAGAVGWMIFACVHGYGGPINWFLSLRMWKLPARLSFAMYLIHFPIIIIANGTWVKTHYFSDGETLHRFAAEVLITFIVAFILCIIVDAPFSTLQKLIFGAGRRPGPKPLTESRTNIVNIEK